MSRMQNLYRMVDREEVITEWMDTGAKGKFAVDNILDEDVRMNTALVLDNQDKQYGVEFGGTMNESTVTTTSLGIGSNTPGSGNNTGYFSPIAMALVRRTFPALFAHKCVGVQPLSGPVGYAFSLRFAHAGYQTNQRGGGDNDDAAFKAVDVFSGFTGSTSGTSAALAAIAGTVSAGTGVGVAMQIAEAWKIGTDYPELKIFLDKKAIEAVTRKLGATFSLESAQDIQRMHGLDMERELINALSYQIVAETDRELLYKMLLASVTTSAGGAAVATMNVSASDGRWSQEKFANVLNLIVKLANDIATSTFQGAGNFVIVSPRVATALQAAGPQFTANTADVTASTTLAEVGKINGTITVYRDAYAGSFDYALVGYKGEGVSNAGLIYSPYVTGLFNRAIDPTNFGVNIGVMSRYAITDSLLGSGRYYRLASFTNLANVLGG